MGGLAEVQHPFFMGGKAEMQLTSFEGALRTAVRIDDVWLKLPCVMFIFIGVVHVTPTQEVP